MFFPLLIKLNCLICTKGAVCTLASREEPSTLKLFSHGLWTMTLAAAAAVALFLECHLSVPL